MNALLDTHAFLWWVMNDQHLSTAAYDLIQKPENTVFVSVACIWEMVIKYHANKLTLPEPPDTYIPSRIRHYDFQILPIEMPHVFQIGHLGHYHRDPFDRIMIAQSQVERLPLVTCDKKIRQYDVDVIW